MRQPTRIVVFAAALAFAAVAAAQQPLPPAGGVPGVPLPGAGGGPGFGGAPVGGPGGIPKGRSGAPAWRTLGRGKAKPADLEGLLDWDLWWEVNDDGFLRARAAERGGASRSSDSDALLGEGERLLVSRVTKADIRDAITPALRRACKDPYEGTRRVAAIALGKVGDGARGDLLETIRAVAGDPEWEVRASGCVGLGLLGSAEGVPLLVAMMKDEPFARQFCGIGSRPVSVKERAFAALGIGCVAIGNGVGPEAIAELVASARARSPHPDLRVFPILALGAMHAFSAASELRRIAFDPEAPEVVRAHAVASLGKLGDSGAVALLVREGLADRSADVQRSAAIALGLLADPDDKTTANALIHASRSAPDRATRNFALIALGQMRSDAGRVHLLATLRRGNSLDRTFAAMGLGVFGARVPASRQEIGKQVLQVHAEARSEWDRAAFSIALGLLDHKPAAAPLLLSLKGGGSPEARGHLATAVGLLGPRDAGPVLQELVLRTSDPGLIMKAAVALGLMGDPGAVKSLVKVFDDAANNIPAMAGAALALGFIGDRSAVAPLVQVLEAKNGGKDYARTYAALALGILGDKRDVRTLAVVQESANYLATTEYLPEFLALY